MSRKYANMGVPLGTYGRSAAKQIYQDWAELAIQTPHRIFYDDAQVGQDDLQRPPATAEVRANLMVVSSESESSSGPSKHVKFLSIRGYLVI